MKRVSILTLPIALWITCSVADPARGQLRVGEVVEVQVGSPHPYPNGVLGRERVWTHTFQHPGATFLKLRFSRFAVAGTIQDGEPIGDYVVVRGPLGESKALLSGVRDADFWTRSVPGDSVVVELFADREGSAAGIEIEAYGYGTLPLSSRSVCGADESSSICDASSSERIRASDPVARILFASDCGGLFLCTGFLFSADGSFMTNAHCANSLRESRSMELWFNYTLPFEEPREPDCSLADRPNPDVFQAKRLLFSDCGLDVAVHQVDTSEKGNPASFYGFLPLSLRAPQAGEAVWIPQHPSGRPKRVAEVGVVSAPVTGGIDYCSDRPACAVGEGSPTGESTEFGHTADTGPGSSGSPVLDQENRVIGLHHAGGCDAAGGENTAVLVRRILPLLGEAPKARLETSKHRLIGTPPLVVELDGSRSFDPDGGAIVEYQFDPGDGSPLIVSDAPRVSHTYEASGRFRAELWVVDDEGTRSKRPFGRRIHTRLR